VSKYLIQRVVSSLLKYLFKRHTTYVAKALFCVLTSILDGEA
jgi:hypothetical protein